MLKASLFVVLSLAASSAMAANTLKINCEPPQGFSGNAAVVKGVLKVVSTSGAYPVLAGKLDVAIGGSSQGTIFSAQRLDAKAVLLDDGIVQALVPAVPRITVITIHLKNKGLSAVELDGKFFKMDCTK